MWGRYYGGTHESRYESWSGLGLGTRYDPGHLGNDGTPSMDCLVPEDGDLEEGYEAEAEAEG